MRRVDVARVVGGDHPRCSGLLGAPSCGVDEYVNHGEHQVGTLPTPGGQPALVQQTAYGIDQCVGIAAGWCARISSNSIHWCAAGVEGVEDFSARRCLRGPASGEFHGAVGTGAEPSRGSAPSQQPCGGIKPSDRAGVFCVLLRDHVQNPRIRPPQIDSSIAQLLQQPIMRAWGAFLHHHGHDAILAGTPDKFGPRYQPRKGNSRNTTSGGQLEMRTGCRGASPTRDEPSRPLATRFRWPRPGWPTRRYRRRRTSLADEVVLGEPRVSVVDVGGQKM